MKENRFIYMAPEGLSDDLYCYPENLSESDLYPYTVDKFLYKIIESEYGVKDFYKKQKIVNQIAKINNINPDDLQIGQEIKLPYQLFINNNERIVAKSTFYIYTTGSNENLKVVEGLKGLG